MDRPFEMDVPTRRGVMEPPIGRPRPHCRVSRLRWRRLCNCRCTRNWPASNNTGFWPRLITSLQRLRAT